MSTTKTINTNGRAACADAPAGTLRLLAGLVMFLASLSVLAVSASAHASTGHADAAAGKQAHSTLSIGDSRDLIGVKFAEGSDVRLRGGHLVSLSRGRIAALDAVLARFPDVTISRAFDSVSEGRLAAARDEARDMSGREQADLNLHFRIRTAPGTDTVALLDALNALDIVEVAAPEPKPVPAPVTPSFVSGQGYRTAAANGGIDADYAQTLIGGKGENVTIVDVEYSWNRSHEDLAKARLSGSALANGTPCDPFAAKDGVHSTDHGTAVLGELTGDPNGLGVTGLAPGASLLTVNTAKVDSTGKCLVDIASAIYVAADNTSPGDVILIEQQWSGPNRTTDSDVGYVPVEWDQTKKVRNAIQNATARGRIVIEPAGNGYQNLDDPVYTDTTTGKNWFSVDSGAIIVGAGKAPGCTLDSDPAIARGRLSFSDYGSRLNVQAWGDCVWTTGYGDLQGGTDSNLWYTYRFGGTSSASPIVAASAAVLSSIAKSRGTTLTPATVRSLLKATGQPQTFGNTGNIGPLPNLKAAIDALGPKLKESAHLVVEGANLGATTVPVRESWSSSGSAAAQYDVWLSTDGGTPVKQTLSSPTLSSAVFQLERNHDYQFVARAADAAGIWGDWVLGTKFNLGEYQEDYSAANPAFTGSWTHAPWQYASDGYLNVSGTAGNKVTFSFTGNNVAWVATKSSNRGQADVYIDGLPVKTVDLYSATTTSAKFIAFSTSWSVSGYHTLEVRVRGTAGHPAVDVDAFVRLR
jgi:serine protease